MIPDIRIKYNGANVRLVGFGFNKLHNLKILEAGIEAIKARLSKGSDENDGPTKPLKKRYARYKSKRTGGRAVRDLNLTGQLLESIKVRYADDRQAIADAGTRIGRIKARIYADLLQFSPADQKQMLELAEEYFVEGVEQSFHVGQNLKREAAVSRQTQFNRKTYFGRAA
jgi:hypothetical protein